MADVTPIPAIKTVPKPRDQHLRDMADCIRFLSMDAVQQAKSGHPGAPMGMADIATVLFKDFMQFDAADPHWFDRDRFVLSNGHASMLLYSLLYLTGVKDMTLDELKRFRQIDSKTAGHPEYRHADGIETTTGPLGQGIANSVGFALAERTPHAGGHPLPPVGRRGDQHVHALVGQFPAKLGAVPERNPVHRVRANLVRTHPSSAATANQVPTAFTERRAWDSNPRRLSPVLAVFKTAAIGH